MRLPQFHETAALEIKARHIGAQLRAEQEALGRSCGNCVYAFLDYGECSKRLDWQDRPIHISAESVACRDWKSEVANAPVVSLPVLQEKKAPRVKKTAQAA